MILIDANLLLYAYDSSTAEHRAARRWLEAAFSQPEPVLLPWASILAFLRISTNPRAWRQPLSMAEAGALVDEWFALPHVTVPSTTERHWLILRSMLAASHCRGPLVSDAHLAALAVEHGATLCSNDRDFARFPDVRVHYPLD
jgi:uncharacterized protein